MAPDSIGANVAYPDEAWDRQQVLAALAEAGFGAEELAGLPNGIDTLVGQGGRDLSGGQAQRVMLARLNYRDAEFLVVDEGTSALDPAAEQKNYDALRKLAAGGAVVVMVAHRPAALAIADDLTLLEKGRVALTGKGEVVRESTAFARLLGHSSE